MSTKPKLDPTRITLYLRPNESAALTVDLCPGCGRERAYGHAKGCAAGRRTRYQRTTILSRHGDVTCVEWCRREALDMAGVVVDTTSRPGMVCLRRTGR